MQDSTVILYIIKLIFGSFASFFAILLWARTRNLPWMFIFLGTIFQYGSIVYNLLVFLGIIPELFSFLFGIPLFTLIFTVLPPIFFVIAFILLLMRSDKYGR